MQFDQKLVTGRLIKRYKRFLADVRLNTGEIITAYCPNTGRMTTCMTPSWRVRLSHNPDPKRKYAYTWEMVHNGRTWIGINTARTNDLAEEAIVAGSIPELTGYANLRREVSYGENSRIDILLSGPKRKSVPSLCYVEVKNVTLVMNDGAYAFPDAVTVRGLKHLRELSAMVAEGHRAVVLFIAQRGDGSGFRPAHEVDPAYAEGFAAAQAAGVEMLAYAADASPQGIQVAAFIPIDNNC